MTTSVLNVSERDCEATLLPLLLGRVFHVSCGRNAVSIAKSGAIQPNVDGQLPSSFGSSQRGFFRLRGCVSVFDFKSPDEATVRDSLWKCAPWYAARRKCDFELAVYFLAAQACDSLLSWKLNHEQRAFSEMVVPYVEAGHPGPIPLGAIDELLLVSIEREPPTALERALAARLPSR